MNKIIILVCLFIIGCGQSNQTQKIEINENPQDNTEVQKLTYDPSTPDIVLINQNNLDNSAVIELTENQISSFSLKIKAINVAGQVRSINSSTDVVISKTCVKTYTVNEECEINIPITASMTGVKLMRIATNIGNRFFSLNIKRQSTSQVSDLRIKGSNVFGNLNEGQKVIKTFTISNSGKGVAENLQLELSGMDSGSYSILYNACEGRNLSQNKTCVIKILFNGKNKSIGSFTTKIKVKTNTGTVDIDQMASQIAVSTVVNSAPVINTNSISAVVGVPLSLQVVATDSDNDQLQYSIQSSLPVTINSSGLITFTPEAIHQGTHSINLIASDNKSPAVSKTVSFKVYNNLNFVGNTSFTEGEIKTPLFGVDVNLGSPIASITSNLTSFITPIEISGSGVSGLINPLINNNSFPLALPNTGNVSFYFGGVVKNAGNYTLQMTVTLVNGEVIQFAKPMTVSSSGLPILKYDLWAAKYSSGTGFNAASILDSVAELKREYAGWRTPILTKMTHQPIVCNGSEISNFDAENTNHLNCLKDNSSTDSETGFIFNAVYSGASQIGGIANGTRKSFVIEKYPWSHTLAHELGHQFGLWHTFESYWNDYVLHCQSIDIGTCYYYNLYENIPGKSLPVVGDWANFLVNFDAAEGIIPYNYVVADDTHVDYFNAQVISIYNPYNDFYPNRGGYANGNVVTVYKGGQSYSSAQGQFACYQIRGSEGSIANGQPYTNPVKCPAVPGRPANYVVPEATIKNTMSYWYHETNSSRFSTNQKTRMDEVISDFPELSNP